MKIGHTGITWGSEIEQALRDTSELGYLGFETFAQTIIQSVAKQENLQKNPVIQSLCLMKM